AARIEAHALADERDLGMARLAPGEIDEARGAGGGPADRVDEREIPLEQVLADDRAHLGAVARSERARPRFDPGGAPGRGRGGGWGGGGRWGRGGRSGRGGWGGSSSFTSFPSCWR